MQVHILSRVSKFFKKLLKKMMYHYPLLYKVRFKSNQTFYKTKKKKGKDYNIDIYIKISLLRNALFVYFASKIYILDVRS